VRYAYRDWPGAIGRREVIGGRRRLGGRGVDCVFKALLGSDDNRALLIHFLNAVLVDDLPAPITEVEILNP
jgi:hypothetical protein